MKIFRGSVRVCVLGGWVEYVQRPCGRSRIGRFQQLQGSQRLGTEWRRRMTGAKARSMELGRSQRVLQAIARALGLLLSEKRVTGGFEQRRDTI